VILNAEVEKLLADLSAFVQQDIEVFATDKFVETAVPAPVESDISTAVDFTGLSQRIAADRQQQDAEDANRDFDEDLLDIFLEPSLQCLL